MKITIIGTTAYQEKMHKHKVNLEPDNEVRMPAFDNFKDMNELEVITYNREAIEWADEVHVLWDARSIGTIFDLGMCFALRKKVKVIYLNNKTFQNFLLQYGETNL
jgi:hypothetical protein